MTCMHPKWHLLEESQNTRRNSWTSRKSMKKPVLTDLTDMIIMEVEIAQVVRGITTVLLQQQRKMDIKVLLQQSERKGKESARISHIRMEQEVHLSSNLMKVPSGKRTEHRNGSTTSHFMTDP